MEDIEVTKSIRYLEWLQSQMRLGNLPPYNQDVYKSIDALLHRLEQLEKELEPIHKLGIPVEVLVSEFDRLENLEDDRVQLKVELEQLEKENKRLKRVVEDRDEWIEILEREGGY